MKENTGLDIELDKSNISTFSYSSFPEDDYVYTFYDENNVVLQTGRIDLWYLYAATLAALIDLGGSISYMKMPEWAWKKWGEVKDMQTDYPLWILQPDGTLKLNEMFKIDE